MSKAFLIRRTSALLVSEKRNLAPQFKTKGECEDGYTENSSHVAHIVTIITYGNHDNHRVPIILFQYISKLT